MTASVPAGPLAVAAALGVALFAVRPYVALDPHTATLALVAIYGGMVAVSAGPAVPGERERALHPLMALGVGVAAVAAVRITSVPVAPPDARAVAILLGVGAAVAEEAYFRRLLYGWFARAGAPLAVCATAVLFGLMHFPAYGAAAMPIDVAAGFLFSWQRWASGSWLVPAATHALANLLAST